MEYLLREELREPRNYFVILRAIAQGKIALSNEANNRILECTHSGEADIIVTGDKAMLRMIEYRGVKIVTLKEFLESF